MTLDRSALAERLREWANSLISDRAISRFHLAELLRQAATALDASPNAMMLEALKQCRSELRRNLQREKNQTQRAWLEKAYRAADTAIAAAEAAGDGWHTRSPSPAAEGACDADDLTWFWQIVDAAGLNDVPSDEREALTLLVKRAAALQAEHEKHKAETAALREREACSQRQLDIADKHLAWMGTGKGRVQRILELLAAEAALAAERERSAGLSKCEDRNCPYFTKQKASSCRCYLERQP